MPQLVYDRDTIHYGVPRRLVEERTRFVGTPLSAPDAFLRPRVRWLVLARGDQAVGRVVEGWLAEGRAVTRARFGALTVVEVLGEIPAP